MKKQLLFYIAILPFFLNAQFIERGSGIAATGREIVSLSVVDEQSVWGVTFDAVSFVQSTNEWTRTTDGGETWETGSLPFSDPEFTTYTVYAHSADTVWMGAGSQPTFTKGAIYKTTDGGQTWEEQLVLADRSPGEFVFWGANEGMTFGSARIGYPNSMKIYRTMDGGTNWTEVDVPSVLPGEAVLAFSGQGMLDSQGDHVWIATIKGRVFHSPDRGLTWEVVDVAPPNRAFTSIAFANEEQGIVVSGINENGFTVPNIAFRTTDGGQTWEEISAPSSPFGVAIEYIPGTAETYIIASFQQGEKNIAITHDGGDTWKQANGPGAFCMEFESPTVGWMGGLVISPTNGGMYRFTSSFDAEHANVATFAGTGTEGFSIGENAKQSQFYNPKGMDMDAEGNVYLADDYNHSIKKITQTGQVSTVAGFNEPSHFGSSAFGRPQDVVVDMDGNLLVADALYNVVKKVSFENGDTVISVFAGTGEFGMTDGPSESATFNGMMSLGMDGAGNIYVGEFSGVRKISPDGMVTTLAGSLNPGFLDGNGADAAFNFAWGLDVSEDGVVYVADFSNHAIRKITPDGDVTTLAGAGFMGYEDGTGSEALFSNPEGVAVAKDGSVYVADGNNSVIRRITPDGDVTTIAGFKYQDFQVWEPGSSTINGDGEYAAFSRLRGILAKPDGNLLVSQWGTDVVQEVQVGVPSHPLVVLEPTIESLWGIGHLRHLVPYTFSSEVQNTASFDIEGVQMQVTISKNGSALYSKTSEIKSIGAGSFEGFGITNGFSPDEAGLFQVAFRFLQNGTVFYTDHQQITVSETTMDYGDGHFYERTDFASLTPLFEGGYGVSFRLENGDSLSGISAAFIPADADPFTVQYSVRQVMADGSTDSVYSSPLLPLDSLVEHGQHLTHLLSERIWLDAGEYVYTIKPFPTGGIRIGMDNDIFGNDNWIEDFASDDWGRISDLFQYQEQLFMIRPIFGHPEIMVSTNEPSARALQIAVSPNPFADQLTIALPADAQRPAVLELASLDGKRLSVFQIRPGESVTETMGYLPSGVYLIRDLLGNGGVVRVVKQ